MRALTFKGVNIIIGENQPEFENLPAHVGNGLVTFCIELDPIEMAEMNNNGGKIYLQQLVGKGGFQPIRLSTVKKELLPDL